MADLKVYTRFDQKLIDEGVLEPQYRLDYVKVHNTLNTRIKKTGRHFGDNVFTEGENILRLWLNTLYRQGAPQEKLTNYLRCGLAHLSFYYMEVTYDTLDMDYLFTRAYMSFKKRDFHKSFFKASFSTDEVKTVKKVKSTKKKTSPVKKKSVKKVPKKKPVKSVKKKVSSKKKAPLKKIKKAAKKPAVKKTKKTSPRKKQVQKKKTVRETVDSILNSIIKLV